MATSNEPIHITASISAETKLRLEAYVREYGVKRSYLIERALQHHLAALDAIPLDVVIPAAVVVSRASGDKLVDMLTSPQRPTDAMKALFGD